MSAKFDKHIDSIALKFVFLMIRRPPRYTQSRSSAASGVYERQTQETPAPRPHREALRNGPSGEAARS